MTDYPTPEQKLRAREAGERRLRQEGAERAAYEREEAAKRAKGNRHQRRRAAKLGQQ